MAAVRINRLKKFFLNTSAFRLSYIFTLFLCSVVVIEPAAVAAKYVWMLWAGYIFYFYYLKNRRVLQVQYCRWLLLFLASTFITALIHVTDNFWGNMLMLAHVAICFFIFYGMHTEKNKKRVRLELFWFCKIMVVATTLLAVVGIPFVLFNLYGEFMGYSLIVFENRFTGLYTNPNLLGFSCVVAIVCCHMLTRKKFLKSIHKRPQSKTLLILCLVCNLLSLFLSDSNSSLILLAFYVIFLACYKIFKWQQTLSFKQAAAKMGKMFLACVGIVLILFASREVFQLGASGITTLTTSQLAAIDQKVLPEQIQDKQPVSFTHLNENIDSGRIRLFTESAILIGNYPLFGIGKANLVPYGERYIEGGLHFSDLHNGYLTILVCAGIVGFVIFVSFALHVARHIVKSLFLEKKDLKQTVFPALFAFICAYCAYAILEKTLLYEQTFMVVVFWLFLGYASCYMLKYDHLEQKIVLDLFGRKESAQADLFDIPTEEENAEEEEPEDRL